MQTNTPAGTLKVQPVPQLAERLRGWAHGVKGDGPDAEQCRRDLRQAADAITPTQNTLAAKVLAMSDHMTSADDVATLVVAAQRIEAAETEAGELRRLLESAVEGDDVEGDDENRRLLGLLELARGEGETWAQRAADWQKRAEDLEACLQELYGRNGVTPNVDETSEAYLERVEDALSAPTLRRFAVPWTEVDGPEPAPGSFVRVGHAGAVWRVHAFEPLEVGGRLATLEPVALHDVPVIGPPPKRVPLPTSEVLEDELDAWKVAR